MIFRVPELSGILNTLRSIRDVLERIAVALEREPSREITDVKWTHGNPMEE